MPKRSAGGAADIEPFDDHDLRELAAECLHRANQLSTADVQQQREQEARRKMEAFGESCDGS